jgi:hypothetical protein
MGKSLAQGRYSGLPDEVNKDAPATTVSADEGHCRSRNFA